MEKTKKAYSRARLFVHGGVERMTLGSQGPRDPTAHEGNDGCGLGVGNGYDGHRKSCATS